LRDILPLSGDEGCREGQSGCGGRRLRVERARGIGHCNTLQARRITSSNLLAGLNV
jgi:hypothetical protein